MNLGSNPSPAARVSAVSRETRDKLKNLMKVLFIDRDGTLINEPSDGKVNSLEKLQINPFVIESLKALQHEGYVLIMVSNQPGLGTDKFPQENFDIPQQKLMDIFNKNGIKFEAAYFCLHEKEENCNCRKPKTGLLDIFLKRNAIDLKNSYVIGDRETDVLLARNIGCKSIFYSAESNPGPNFNSSNWNKIAEWIKNDSDRDALI